MFKAYFRGYEIHMKTYRKYSYFIACALLMCRSGDACCEFCAYVFMQYDCICLLRMCVFVRSSLCGIVTCELCCAIASIVYDCRWA